MSNSETKPSSPDRSSGTSPLRAVLATKPTQLDLELGPQVKNECYLQTPGPGPEGRKCGECANLHGYRLTPEDRTSWLCTITTLPQARQVTAPACAWFTEPSAVSYQPSAVQGPRPLIAES